MQAGSALRIPSQAPPGDFDQRLVEGVLRKDRKATAEFVSLCADAIYSFVRRRLVPRVEGVEDMMQEILLAAWQGLPNFRRDSTLRSWILGIAKHKVDAYYRKQLRSIEIPGESAAEPAIELPLEQELDAAAKQDRVQRTLGLLPEAYALALIWRYRDEKSVREMAQLSGKTEKAMKRLLARARENFRRRWSDVRSQ